MVRPRAFRASQRAEPGGTLASHQLPDGAAPLRRSGRGRRVPRGCDPVSVFEELGGAQGLRTAVAVLYRRVVADPELRQWFDGVDLRRLRSHQAVFLTAVTGGPQLYAGRGLAEAHGDLGVTDEAFDRVRDHLTATLRDLGAAPAAVARVAERVEALRPAVVAR